MKKLIYLLPVLALFFAASCSDSENEGGGGSSTLKLTVTAILPDEISAGDVISLTFTVTNRNTAAEKIITSETLNAEFSLYAGQYDIRVSGEANGYSLNGLSQNVGVYETKEINVSLLATLPGSLIFKEVYFTGVPQNYFHDQFYEIYNNSDEVQYLDGVILGVVDFGKAVNTWNPQPSTWAVNGVLPDRYPMDSYVQYFPGSGTDYPVQPRTSVLIAANPIDHSSRKLEAGDAASPVNLTGANWQLFTDQSPTDSKIEGYPCMEYAWRLSKYAREMMPATDGQSFILAKLPAGSSVADFVADEANFQAHPSVTQTHLMIPAAYVIDAIDIVCAVESERYKTIRTSEDAGMAWIDGSNDGSLLNAAYSGKSLRRKVIGFTDGGKPIYKDTNNSSNDFVLGGGVPTPGVHPTTAD